MGRRRWLLVGLTAVLLGCASSAPVSAPPLAPAPLPSMTPPPPAPTALAEPPPPVAPPVETGAPGVRSWTDWRAPLLPGDERAKQAILRRRPEVERLFAKAAVSFPPAELLFRGFKREHELEVWASSQKGGAMTKIATYAICRLSGELGPKRYEGDGQVPEGFYKINYYWPESAFHLEMKIGYPNAADKAISRGDPGGNIMIHGACASAGCLAMSDERAEELWTMAILSGGEEKNKLVHVHLFPSRTWDDLLRDAAYAPHHRFWANLKEGFDAFEKSRTLPSVSIDWQARYVVR